MKPTIKWIIFDFYDTLIAGKKAKEYLYGEKILWKIFQKHGLKIPRTIFYEKLGDIRRTSSHKELMPKNKNTVQLLAHELGYKISLKQAKIIQSNQYTSKNAQIKLLPHAKKLLKWINGYKIKTAIITNANSPGVYYNLKRHKLTNQISKIIISDQIGALKSEITPFKKFLKDNEVRPTECLMIGDNIYEDTYAQKVGIPTAIFEINIEPLTRNEIDKLKKKGLFPKFRINSLDDIREIINENYMIDNKT